MGCDDVITGDCLEVLAGLPAGCADLVFADPPFNIGYEYDVYDDRRAKADYLAWTEKWLAACVRVLKPTGSFFLAIGAYGYTYFSASTKGTGTTIASSIEGGFGLPTAVALVLAVLLAGVAGLLFSPISSRLRGRIRSAPDSLYRRLCSAISSGLTSLGACTITR